MAIEVRHAREDELDRVHYIVAYSFNAPRTAEGREQMRHVEELAPPPTVLLDGGEPVACLRVFPFRMLVNGAPIAMGGVSSVACLPEHRRRGHVGRLLRHALGQMREAGQPLSALYTPHPDLYRRYGWIDASSALRYSWNPKRVAPLHTHPPAGRAVRVGEDEWRLLEPVYRCFSAGRTGYLERGERWWKEAVFRRLYDPKREPNDVAVWADAKGEAAGYVVYRSAREHRVAGPDSTTLFVQETAALSGDAYLGLLRYIQSHDLADEVVWYGPVDAPLALMLDNPREVKRETVDGFMLRVVDVERAIAARPPAAGAPEGAFTLGIRDAAAPWNQGAWRIECSSGRLEATRTEAAADISMGADAFAAVYDGFLLMSEAARGGLASVSDYRAALLADRVLASDYPPFGSDFF